MSTRTVPPWPSALSARLLGTPRSSTAPSGRARSRRTARPSWTGGRNLAPASPSAAGASAFPSRAFEQPKHRSEAGRFRARFADASIHIEARAETSIRYGRPCVFSAQCASGQTFRRRLVRCLVSARPANLRCLTAWKARWNPSRARPDQKACLCFRAHRPLGGSRGRMHSKKYKINPVPSLLESGFPVSGALSPSGSRNFVGERP